MEISLEKIDLIRERTGLGYAEAKEALEEAAGDVIDALVMLEEELEDGMEELGEAMEQGVFAPVKKVISQGNRTRIRVSNHDGTLLEIPATLGIAGALIAPRATALGVMALLMAHYSLEVTAPEMEQIEWQN